MGMTISMAMGRVAILHDIRKDISRNVDTSRTKDNEIFVDKLKEYNYDLVAYTDRKFQPAIDKYNAGKKNCRQIHDTYTEHLAKENKKLLQTAKEKKEKGINSFCRKPRKLAYEFVLQVGDRNSNGVRMSDKAEIERNRIYLRSVLDQIRKKYQHIDILLATYHADEVNGTPHMHMLVQFNGEGYKKGLSQQISVSKALELEGYERAESRGSGRYAMQEWINDIKDNIMEPELIKHFGQTREELGEHRKHIPTAIFRSKAIEEDKEMAEKKQIFKREAKEAEIIHQKALSSTSDLLKIDKQIKQLTAERDDLIDQISDISDDIETFAAYHDKLHDEISRLENKEIALAYSIVDDANRIRTIER